MLNLLTLANIQVTEAIFPVLPNAGHRPSLKPESPGPLIPSHHDQDAGQL